MERRVRQKSHSTSFQLKPLYIYVCAWNFLRTQNLLKDFSGRERRRKDEEEEGDENVCTNHWPTLASSF